MAVNQGVKTRPAEFTARMGRAFGADFDAQARLFRKMPSMASGFNIQLLMDRLRL